MGSMIFDTIDCSVKIRECMSWESMFFSPQRGASNLGSVRPSVRASVRASVRPSVDSRFSETPGRISFKVGMYMDLFPAHMHVILFRDPIQDGRPPAILNVKTAIFGPYMTMS